MAGAPRSHPSSSVCDASLAEEEIRAVSSAALYSCWKLSSHLFDGTEDIKAYIDPQHALEFRMGISPKWSHMLVSGCHSFTSPKFCRLHTKCFI